MLSIRQDQEENQNVAQAPTLGRTTGSISQGGGTGQKRNVSQRGSGYTNLQQYVTANENNANPEIVRQRTTQAGTGLQQAQTGFENVAQQARTGLQGIQGVNTFVQGVLANPTAAVANPSNLQRFQNLRTGTEGIANLANVYQPFTQAQAGFGSQREQLASGLRTDTTGSGLQDYIRSQRANPSLATQGENVLDRFLTESTTAGKTALQQAQERAGQIQATALPDISGQVETLKSQVSPLSYITQQGIQSGVNAPTQEEQNYLSNININEGKNLIARSMGKTTQELDPELADLNYRINKIKKTNEQRDENLRVARNSLEYQADLADLEAKIFADSRSGNQQWAREARDQGKRDIENKYKNKTNLGTYQGETYIDELLQGAPNIALKNYESKVNQIPNINKQRLLQLYDPNRLARVQALQTLSGQDLSSLLSQGVS
jgi:hypothetical protein